MRVVSHRVLSARVIMLTTNAAGHIPLTVLEKDPGKRVTCKILLVFTKYHIYQSLHGLDLDRMNG